MPPRLSTSRLSEWFASLVNDALGALGDWLGEEGAYESERDERDDPRALRHVRQQHTTGCGIAIVAMAASVPYPRARLAMFGASRRRHFYTTFSDVKRGFDHFGVGYAARAKRFSQWKTLAPAALLRLKNSKADGGGSHWVLFLSEEGETYVLDPSAKGYVRDDWKRMHVISYLPLERKTMFRKRARKTKPKKAELA